MLTTTPFLLEPLGFLARPQSWRAAVAAIRPATGRSAALRPAFAALLKRRTFALLKRRTFALLKRRTRALLKRWTFALLKRRTRAVSARTEFPALRRALAALPRRPTLAPVGLRRLAPPRRPMLAPRRQPHRARHGRTLRGLGRRGLPGGRRRLFRPLEGPADRSARADLADRRRRLRHLPQIL